MSMELREIVELHGPDIVGTFKTAISPDVATKQEAALNKLGADPEVGRLWHNFFVKQRDAGHMGGLLFRIIDIHRLAGLNETALDVRDKVFNERFDLLEAAHKLETFFRQAIVLASDAGETDVSAIEANRQILAGKLSMVWTQRYIAKLLPRDERHLTDSFLLSQKRDQPHLAFALQTIREFEERYDKKAYPLITAMTAALYQIKSSGLQASIEGACRREAERRGAGLTLSDLKRAK